MEAEFEGEFETHLTVRLDPRPGTGGGERDESARLERWAERNGLKLTRIVWTAAPCRTSPC
ncbi:hypothetical protein [Streptomyces atratus]|uniref:Uncharacterized protein n=1 Tax=Streptomyces atratus TaxID=1893 RepID=A0A2Z5JL03_STRAR|nr:hypothetical protein [Streptomyces atratus]AXE81147.1 hypothetical protein C5746_34040 [Streptomyces atratus]